MAERYCMDGAKCIASLCGENREACLRAWRWNGNVKQILANVPIDDLLAEIKRRIG